MSVAARFTPLLLAAACFAATRQSGAPSHEALPSLSHITSIHLTDAVSGAPLGTVQRADSVATFVALYGRLADGWVEGPASFSEVGATFYRDTLPLAYVALASGAFEARVGGRVLHRAASGDEALAFAHVAGVPIEHGSSWLGARQQKP
jgi:hypothetical protein